MDSLSFPLAQSSNWSFVLSIGVKCLIAKVDALNSFVARTLNDSYHNITLVNVEMDLMPNAVLQYRMVLDILTASQGELLL